MSVKEFARELLISPKVSATIAAGTTSSGVGAWLDYIPDDIGKLATLIGAILSIVLISYWILTFRKTLLEMKIMRIKEKERVSNIILLRRRETD